MTIIDNEDEDWGNEKEGKGCNRCRHLNLEWLLNFKFTFNTVSKNKHDHSVEARYSIPSDFKNKVINLVEARTYPQLRNLHDGYRALGNIGWDTLMAIGKLPDAGHLSALRNFFQQAYEMEAKLRNEGMIKEQTEDILLHHSMDEAVKILQKLLPTLSVEEKKTVEKTVKNYNKTGKNKRYFTQNKRNELSAEICKFLPTDDDEAD